MLLYSVKDKLSKEFAPPFTAKNVEVAMRTFRNSLAPMPLEIRTDFQLYFLGQLDERTGQLKAEFVFVSDYIVPKVGDKDNKGEK